MESTSLNYTNVCWYCGTIYKSNRSTSKYCCKKHNSLFSLHGPRISPSFNEDGIVVNYDSILEEIFQEDINKDLSQEAHGFLLHTIRQDFKYHGPLPVGDELLIIGSYVLKRSSIVAINSLDIFYVRPFTLLTEIERMCAVIIAYPS